MNIYFVTQQPYLFSGSIAENICLGKSDSSNEDLKNAAKFSYVLEFAKNFPNGLDTVLGKNGYGISMGQAQRIGIARLFLRNPKLILLDEPTAHLDEKMQDSVLKEILEFSKDRTLLLVTHSFKVASQLPIVWNLSKGKIITL
ncbi:MAG: ATP-binding cassette domain-containing protein [Bordetella sp.]|nr:MAG: ATP-binding cassette domain-containing protein [Bordetella sp.]